ncbi:hypothetical protein BGZ65_009104 [Modicella reniformis]|uniref:Exonuclease domain-containing protein n=1 Tax=Modicella reniformis TaxID=1440133 RepID=A0A9P6MEK8_9FUNG|nr:hypothetical protein BGZ65_009104 [Modicella reniformis]
MVKNKFNVHKVVLLHVSGLDPEFFHVNLHHPDSNKPITWTEKATEGPVTEFEHLKSFFNVMNVLKTGGDKHRLFSPVEAFLSLPLSNSEKIQNEKEVKSKNKSAPTLKPENYLLTPNDLRDGDYPLPSYLALNTTLEKDWIETKKQTIDPSTLRNMIAMDCEMVITTAGSELARISLVDEENEIVYDELVMPDNPITDYLTQYSGISAERLEGVSTKLIDVQKKLSELITYDTILVGHSLENDLKVLKFAHPFIIDTAKIYHHTRGPPFRPALKWLVHRWLARKIQNGGHTGHDSVEDATACMDLTNLKIKRGPGFGEFNQVSQSIFARLARHIVPQSSVVIDSEAVPGEASANTIIKVKTDNEVIRAVSEAIGKHNFVWTRLRAMEINHDKTSSGPDDNEDDGATIGDTPGVLDSPSSASTSLGGEKDEKVTEDGIREAVRSLDRSIAAIVDSLPTNTALIVASGHGNTQEVQRLQAKQKKFQQLYNSVELSSIPKEDQFLDEDQKLLQEAVNRARNGVCFLMVK